MSLRAVPRLGFLVCTLMLGACASVTVPATVLRPAELDLDGHRHLAMWKVDGRLGPLIGDRVSQGLFESPRFEIVDQANLRRILKQQGEQVSDAFDQATQALIGQLTGATAAVSGEAMIESFSEHVTPVPFEEVYKDSQGRAIVRNRVRNVREGLARMRVRLQITDLASGKVIARKSLERTREVKTEAVDGEPPQIDGEGLLLQCVDQVAADFVLAVVPRGEQQTFQLYRGDGMLQLSRQDELERGISHAQHGHWSLAADAFGDAVARYEAADREPELLARARFNQAVALALSQRFDEAFATLNQARSVMGGSDLSSLQRRLEQMRADDNRLKKQVGDPRRSRVASSKGTPST